MAAKPQVTGQSFGLGPTTPGSFESNATGAPLAAVPGVIRDQRMIFYRHNSWHEQWPENAAFEALAAADSRVVVRLGTLTGREWMSLLQRVDVIALPYDQRVYSTATSGVALEAIPLAIPLVVPQGTPMARLLQDYGSPGIISETADVADVVDAIGRLLDDFPAYARRATAASLDWTDRAGPEHVLRAILASSQGF